MEFPTPQGRSSLTFTPPPIDGSLSFAEIVDYNGWHSPNHPLFRYEDSDSEDVRTILWSEGVAAFHTVGQHFQKYLADEACPVVVGILANSGMFSFAYYGTRIIKPTSPDTLTFFATIIGIMRLGHIPFPISIRNSAPAVAYLMKATNSKYLVVTADSTIQKIADIVCNHNVDERIVTTIPMPTFSNTYVSSYEPLPPFKQPDWTETAFIMHSSGTTRYPSPILRSHQSMLQLIKASCTPPYISLDQGLPLPPQITEKWTSVMKYSQPSHARYTVSASISFTFAGFNRLLLYRCAWFLDKFNWCTCFPLHFNLSY